MTLMHDKRWLSPQQLLTSASRGDGKVAELLQLQIVLKCHYNAIKTCNDENISLK